jgi:hypothetical protein
VKDFSKINAKVKELIEKGAVNPHVGEAKQVVPVKITGANDHARMRGVTLEEAQSFVDTAEVMFDQKTRNMYLSRDGSATVLVENGRVISAYRRENFDPAIKAIFEVVDNE